MFLMVMKRALCFYVKTQSAPNTNLATIMLSALHKRHIYHLIDSKYLSYINKSLVNIGLPFLFNLSINPTSSIKETCTHIKDSVTDFYLHNWHINIDKSSKAIFYRQIKENHEFEQYLDILPKAKRITLMKYTYHVIKLSNM